MLVNAVYLRALGLEGLAATTTPASKAAERTVRRAGATRFVTAAIAISTFGFLDLAILAPTRVYYAMAADRRVLPGARTAPSRVSGRPGSRSSFSPPGRASWRRPAATSSCSTTSSSPTGSSSASPSAPSSSSAGRSRWRPRAPELLSRPRLSRRPDPVRPHLPPPSSSASSADDPASALRGALLLALGIPVYFWFGSTTHVARSRHSLSSISRSLTWSGRRPGRRPVRSRGSNVLALLDRRPRRRRRCPGAFSGRNDNGYAPLLEAIAGTYGVRPAQVTTAQGTSGANFLVCAALLEPGDDVLVEAPGYDPLLGARAAARRERRPVRPPVRARLRAGSRARRGRA